MALAKDLKFLDTIDRLIAKSGFEMQQAVSLLAMSLDRAQRRRDEQFRAAREHDLQKAASAQCAPIAPAGSATAAQ